MSLIVADKKLINNNKNTQLFKAFLVKGRKYQKNYDYFYPCSSGFTLYRCFTFRRRIIFFFSEIFKKEVFSYLEIS
jgi:hypothetical protein